MKRNASIFISGFLSLAVILGVIMFAALTAGTAAAATGPAPLPRPPAGTSRDSVLQYYSNGAFGDTRLSFEERAADLISRMTRAEKIAQLQATTSQTGAIPTLGVTAYRWWNEALHGIARDGTATSFPSPLNLGATWDTDLMLKCMTVSSTEGRAKSNAQYSGTSLTYWSPTINLARDPRWGRNEESYGEDPFLTGVMASAFTRGMQGDPTYDSNYSSKYLKAVATMKHFAANNTEATRRGGDSAMDDRSLREYYTANFQYIAEHAGIMGVMSAYNKVNSVPAAANTYLLDDLLRKTWGFKGYVTSDCDAIQDVFGSGGGYWSALPANNRTLAGVGWSVIAGTDTSCGSSYINNVDSSINAGFMTDDDLDRILMDLFVLRFKCGEFDPVSSVPYRSITTTAVGTKAGDDLALEAADKSIVLLKNEAPAGETKKILPVNLDTFPSDGKIVLVGHLADLLELGDYSAASVNYSTTIRQGLQNYINAYNTASGKNITLSYYQCYSSQTATDATQISNAAAAAATADLTIVYVGAGYVQSTYRQAQEGTDRPNLNLFASMQTTLNGVLPSAKRAVVAMAALGFYDIGPFLNNTDAFIWSSYNGQQQGTAFADVLFGKVNPSARLNFTWLKDINQYPAMSVYNLRAESGSNGRTYQYFTGDVTWPFGYGLSYTDFKVTNVQMDKAAAGVKDTVKVTFDVENLGDMAGAQTVQLYVTSPMAYNGPGGARNGAYPFKQLKGFAKVQLAAHEKKTNCSIEFNVNDLFFFDSTALADQVDSRTGRPSNAAGTGKRVVYSGDYKIAVATSSADADVVDTKILSVTGTDAPGAKPWLKTVTLRGEKVWAAPGTKLKSRLSVAMSDEMLYQAVADSTQTAPEEFNALLAKLTAAGINCSVQFSSSNPAVATVTQQGQVMAKTNGVTTITAAVTVDGVTLNASYPFAVNGIPLQDTENAYITGISVNGQPLADFDKDITDYDVTLAFGSNMPSITCTNGGNMASVKVDTPPTIPGKATITVANLADENDPNYVVSVYTITINTSAANIGILLDGSPLAGFDPSVLDYTVKLDKTNPVVPVVSVDTKGDAGLNAQISYKKVLDVTTASVVISKGASSVTYTIVFKPKSGPQTDIFTLGRDKMRPFWFIAGGREDKSGYWLEPTGLRIRCLSGDIGSGAPNIFLQEAGDDDWTITVDLTMSPMPNNVQYPQADLMVWQDDLNWVKVDLETSSSTAVKFQVGDGVNGSNTYGGAVTVTVGTAANQLAAGDPISLRIVRSGDTYTCGYKFKTNAWANLTGKVVTKKMTNVKVGIGALYSGTKPAANNFDVTFKNFMVDGESYQYDQPVITKQPPANTTVTQGNVGDTIGIEAEVAPYGGTLTYQWFEAGASGDTPVPGATGAVLDIPPDLSVGVHSFYCVASLGPDCVPDPVTQVKSVTSDTAKVTVEAWESPPVITITKNPTSAISLPLGGSATIDVAAEFDVVTGVAMKYQWYASATGNTGGVPVAGATNAAFAIPTDLYPGDTYYYCVVSGSHPDIKSVTSTATKVTVGAAPVISITRQPAPAKNVTQGVISGSVDVRAQFNTATALALKYQWYSSASGAASGGAAIAGATDALFVIPANLTAGVTYYYYCVVSGSHPAIASVTSAVTKVTVGPPVAARPHSDVFTNGRMRPFWFIDGGRENKDGYWLDKNGLTIRALAGDIIRTATSGQNIFLQEAGNGDWVISTQFTMNRMPNGLTYPQGALIAMQDDDNWVKLDLETNNASTVKFQISKEVAGTFTSVQALPSGGMTVGAGISASDLITLRLARAGTTYTGSYRINNGDWTDLTAVTGQVMNDVKVGILNMWGMGGTDIVQPTENLDVTYKNFIVENDYAPWFTDANIGYDISALTEDTLRVTLPYNAAASQKLTMIVALYDGSGRLVQIGKDERTPAVNVWDAFDVALTMPANYDGHYAAAGYKAVVYLWDSGTFSPIASKILFP